MIRELRLRNFRGFPDFSLPSLGRVNLLVGTNNCGKTTLLEAVEIAANRDLQTFATSIARRGERKWDESGYRTRFDLDLSHLFTGHSIRLKSAFAIECINDIGTSGLRATIVMRPQKLLFALEESEIGELGIELNWFRHPSARKNEEFVLPLGIHGGLAEDIVRRGIIRQDDFDHTPLLFVSTDALTASDMTSFFDEVVLTDEEANVIQALQCIEPSIERLAAISIHRSRNTLRERAGIVVKCTGVDQRLPIGSMGDGIWRLLGLALALVRCQGGILLVDEIDTGLHFSVMADMWNLVYETAKRLNVQVFATTHSRDCYESLAAIARENVSEQSDVTLHRIERGRNHSIAFTEQEIFAAAERGLEVR